jgi:uncharacterized membrane protein (DUF485 family)
VTRDERLVPPRADETLLELTDQTVYGEILLEDLVRRQLTLALSITAIFLALLVGLPLGSVLAPGLFATPILGLPLGWVLIAVAVYPVLWLLAAYYVSASKQNEDEFTELVSR